MSDWQPRAYVGVGSNLAPANNIAGGLRALAAQFGALRISTAYESAALEGTPERYWNLAVAFDTVLNWSQLRGQLKAIEDRHGRDRHAPRGAPVALDLDLLILRDAAGADDTFDLPLAELARASYVLAPLAELLPAWRHPEAGRTLAELWRAYAPTAVPLAVVAAPPWQGALGAAAGGTVSMA